MQRSIDGPDSTFVDAKEAARWIGVSEDLFEKLAAAEDWMRPTYFGTGRRRLKKWAWMDVVCLAHILGRRVPGAADAENNSADGAD